MYVCMYEYKPKKTILTIWHYNSINRGWMDLMENTYMLTRVRQSTDLPTI